MVVCLTETEEMTVEVELEGLGLRGPAARRMAARWPPR